ncbi:hypothetical protein ACFQHN_21745 [Natrialbaceae archaeon GCM10025896]
MIRRGLLVGLFFDLDDALADVGDLPVELGFDRVDPVRESTLDGVRRLRNLPRQRLFDNVVDFCLDLFFQFFGGRTGDLAVDGRWKLVREFGFDGLRDDPPSPRRNSSPASSSSSLAVR